MIAALCFGEPRVSDGGQTLGEMTFRKRSTLPLAAVCLVGNGVREQLARLFSSDFEVSVFEPVIPERSARQALFTDALAYRVHGRLCDVFILLRPADVQALLCAAFGEVERSEREPLSEIERTTLDRMVAVIAPLCIPLCGEHTLVRRESAERADIESVTYFEVRTSGKYTISLGFALTRDPPEEISQRLLLDDLLDVRVRGRVECARGEIALEILAALEPGMLLPLRTRLDETGILRFGQVVFAKGVCGAKNGVHALVVGGA